MNKISEQPESSISDNDFKLLKANIRKAWRELKILQEEYRLLTGKRYEWFK